VTEPRAAVRDLAEALRVLHHRLLLATQRSFEKLHGRVPGPGALLELTLHDPLFAWLRPLSQHVAELDELAAAEELTATDVEQARATVAKLLEQDSEFRASYLVYLQSDPDAVIAHATLRRLLEKAPQRG
jgi:hypothetical protein